MLFFFVDPWGFKGSMVIVCVYKDLHDLLLTDQIKPSGVKQTTKGAVIFILLHVVYLQKNITRKHIRSKFNLTELINFPKTLTRVGRLPACL